MNIEKWNEWWWSGKVRKEFVERERKVLGEILRYLPHRQIIGIRGIRRVGKTTLHFLFFTTVLMNILMM